MSVEEVINVITVLMLIVWAWALFNLHMAMRRVRSAYADLQKAIQAYNRVIEEFAATWNLSSQDTQIKSGLVPIEEVIREIEEEEFEQIVKDIDKEDE